MMQCAIWTYLFLAGFCWLNILTLQDILFTHNVQLHRQRQRDSQSKVKLRRVQLSTTLHLTCHMGSHPTLVNTPRRNPSHTGCRSIYLPWRYGRLS